jgi:hypothetical protein
MEVNGGKGTHWRSFSVWQYHKAQLHKLWKTMKPRNQTNRRKSLTMTQKTITIHGQTSIPQTGFEPLHRAPGIICVKRPQWVWNVRLQFQQTLSLKYFTTSQIRRAPKRTSYRKAPKVLLRSLVVNTQLQEFVLLRNKMNRLLCVIEEAE